MEEREVPDYNEVLNTIEEEFKNSHKKIIEHITIDNLNDNWFTLRRCLN